MNYATYLFIYLFEIKLKYKYADRQLIYVDMRDKYAGKQLCYVDIEFDHVNMRDAR